MSTYASFTSPARDAEFLISEGEGHISRDTIVAGAALPAGAVVGVSSNAAVYADPAAGTPIAAVGVNLRAVASGETAVIVKRLAEVNGSLLVYKPAMSGGSKTTVNGQLAALSIVIR